MPADIIAWELHCPACADVERCGLSQMLLRLQSLGLLRRSKDPDPSLVVELFQASAGKLACSHCGRRGLTANVATDEEWNDATVGRDCEACGRPIAMERLAALPNTRRCAACQQLDESNTPDEVEYCPRCGEIMKVRLSSGSGLSRYALTCPQCRR